MRGGVIDIKWLDALYHAREVFNSKFPDIQADFDGSFLKECGVVGACIGLVGTSVRLG